MLCVSLVKMLEHRFLYKELNRRLMHNEAFYRSIFEQAPVGIAIVNDKTFVGESAYGRTVMNRAFENILGRTKEELVGVRWPDITHSEDLEVDLKKFNQFKAGIISDYSMEKRFIRPDGSSVWTKMRVGRLAGGDSDSLHLCLLEDISESKAISDNLKESERSKTVLISNLPGMAYRCDFDPSWTMHFISEGCYNLTGYRPESLICNKDVAFNDIISPEYRESLRNEWKRAVEGKLPFKYEYEITTADGKRKWVLEMGQGVYDEQGNVVALEGIILDISDRKEMEDKLRHYNEHDSLTGLLRRHCLIEQLERGNTKKRALVGVNLSTVHSLNATYGFQYTQDLIKRIAGLLKQECNKNRVLFKIYEAQFAYLITDYKDIEEISNFCRAVAQRLETVLALERIGGGIGVLEVPQYSRVDANELIKKLMVVSERAIGPGSYNYNIGILFYDKQTEQQISREEEIRQTLLKIAETDENSELYLHYQPIYDLKSMKITGFEALARMKTEKLGMVSPVEFIHIAEETKLIVPVGYKIIRQALGFLRRLGISGYDDINVSVNISVIQLLMPDFTSNLLQIASEMQVNPANIGIELTETIFASDFDEINRIISELRAQKIQVAIDDFGIGYSTLAREHELQVDHLKIDKCFIDKLKTNRPQNVMTADIISMAHKLGHCVVAEGVEQCEQIRYLYEYGCDKIQGYLISRPQDEGAALELLGKELEITGYCNPASGRG
jgi:PAS domain S-box-containing protein